MQDIIKWYKWCETLQVVQNNSSAKQNRVVQKNAGQCKTLGDSAKEYKMGPNNTGQCETINTRRCRAVQMVQSSTQYRWWKTRRIEDDVH